VSLFISQEAYAYSVDPGIYSGRRNAYSGDQGIYSAADSKLTNAGTPTVRETYPQMTQMDTDEGQVLP